jgi:DNA-binding transcriptional LysR family regulator
MDWSDRIGRRIKLRDLHILQAVARYGSMAKAARHLAVSQPVVSKAIADLERQVGKPLMDRDRHGAEPTIYGVALLKHGLAVFDELKQSVKEIEYLSDPAVGELRIGTPNVLAAGFVAAVVKSLHRHHPKLAIHATLPVAVETLYRELRERNVDLVVDRLPQPFAEQDLKAEVLFNETTVIVAGRRNPLTRRRKVTFADLVDEPWIFPAAGSAADRIAAEMFKANGLEMPRQRAIFAPMPLAAALVANGPYLANFPASLVRFGGKHLQVAVLPVEVPLPPSPVGVITMKRRTTSPAVQAFIEHAHDLARSMG